LAGIRWAHFNCNDENSKISLKNIIPR
jgi:hypothetical protein